MPENNKIQIKQPEVFGDYSSWIKLMEIKYKDEILDYMYALEIPNNGCLVKVYNRNEKINQLMYIPNTHIVEDTDDNNEVIGRHLENN